MPDRTRDGERPPEPPKTIDQRLYRAWLANDRKACEEIWDLFNARIYTVAVLFCRSFVDESTARQVATSALSKAWEELEWEDAAGKEVDGAGAQRSRKVKKSAGKPPRAKRAGKLAIAWQGGPQLEKYVRNLVINRCRDELRLQWRWLARLDDVQDDAGDEEGSSPSEALGTTEATQQDDLLREERDRDGVRRIVLELAALVESCGGPGGDSRRAALLDVVVEMRAYLRDRFIEAGPLDSAIPGDGRDWAALTLEELAEAVDPHGVKATRSAMYEHIMERLNLPNKNTLYARIADISAMRHDARR